MKRGLKIFLIILGVLLVIAIGIVSYLVWLFSPASFGEHVPVDLSAETLPGYLSAQQIVKSLPKTTDIQVNFGENEYVIEEGSIDFGESEDPDVTIELPEEYIDKIGEEGLCVSLQEAIANGDLEVTTEMTEAELMWKYRALLKYRGCITGEE